MHAPTIVFFASAAVASIAAVVAVSARDSMRSLAGFSVALAAVIVPLVQLRAPLVAGVLLASTLVSVLLLGALARLRHQAVEREANPHGGRRPSTGGLHGREKRAVSGGRSRSYVGLAGIGLLGFGWVLLATGSRQVVESGPALTIGNSFGDSSAVLLELADAHLVPGLLVGLLALCCVIAAVLALVADEGRGASS